MKVETVLEGEGWFERWFQLQDTGVFVGQLTVRSGMMGSSAEPGTHGP